MARPSIFVTSLMLLFGGGALSPDTAWARLPGNDEGPAQIDTVRGPILPIGDVRYDFTGNAVPDRLGDTVTVGGRVTASRSELPVPIPHLAVIQDSTGGLHVRLTTGPSVERGDSLHVRGIVQHKYGLTQLEALDYTPVEAPSRVPEPVPLTVSAAAAEHYEGELVRIEGRIFAAGSNEGGDYLRLEEYGNDETEAEITIFVAERDASRVSLDGFHTGTVVQITGVLGQHDYDAPYVDYYQVQPREQADLTRVQIASQYLWWTLYGLGTVGLLAVVAVLVLRTTVRRRTRELRESRSRLRGLANSVPGVIFRLSVKRDASFEFQFVGARAKEMLGLSAETESFFERLLDRIPSSHRTALLNSLNEATAQKENWHFEFPFVRPSGQQMWLLAASSPEQRGDSVLFNGVLLDITERKHAEGKARLQTKILRRITEGAPLKEILAELVEELEAQRPNMFGSVLLYDSADNVVRHGAAPNLPDEYNEAVDGLKVGPEIGSCGSAVHSRSPVITEDIETDPCWEGSGREIALKHDLRACWSVPIQDADGTVLGTFAMYYQEPKTPTHSDWRVIEEARSLARIAIERHRETERLRLLTEAVEQSTEAILITESHPLDPPGPRIEYVNPAFEEMTGYRNDEVVGRNPRLLQGPDTDRDVLDSLRDALVNGKPWEGEAVNYRKDGTPYRVHWSVAPVYARDGEIMHWVSVQRDVTEARQREQELKDAKEAAEEAARLKSALLANMSHEIRTPLTSIIGFAEALGDDPEERDLPTTRFAELIEKSGQRLLKTLDAVLTLSKLEAGRMDLAEEPINVRVKVQEIAEQFGEQAAEADVNLHVDENETSVCAKCDEGALQIVLHNLVSNAIKYTKPGGQVRIKTYERDGGTILEVQDSGIGMDKEEVDELFEPFRQASEGMDREYEGTGLGLAVTKEAVKQMGGTIEVETEKGEGTRFIVFLPCPETSKDPSVPTNGSPEEHVQ